MDQAITILLELIQIRATELTLHRQGAILILIMDQAIVILLELIRIRATEVALHRQESIQDPLFNQQNPNRRQQIIT